MANEWHFVRVVGSAVPFCGAARPEHTTTVLAYVTCSACRVAALAAEKASSVKPASRPSRYR
jgi:hypothetical protein